MVAEDPTKELRSKKKGKSKERAKPEKPEWQAYSPGGMKLQERMEPEKWPWERWVPRERMYPSVWVELAKGV